MLKVTQCVALFLSLFMILGFSTASAAVGIYCVKATNPNAVHSGIKPTQILRPTISIGNQKSTASASSNSGTLCVVTKPIPSECEIQSNGVEVPVSISKAPNAAKTFFMSGPSQIEVFTFYGTSNNKTPCKFYLATPPISS